MIIGITGGIGSGKSTIAEHLREMGYPVYDTDTQAKRIIMEDPHVRAQITELFGSEVYRDGIYQTAIVAQRVFASPHFRGESEGDLLAKLNAIVHPAVKEDIRYWVADVENKSLLFIECAILYQAGFDQLCDKVVAVTAPETIRLERVIARDHSDINKVRNRMRAQRAEEYLQHADIIINNDGTIPVSRLCQDILQLLIHQ